MVIMKPSLRINEPLLDIIVNASSGGAGKWPKPLQPGELEQRYYGGRGGGGRRGKDEVR